MTVRLHRGGRFRRWVGGRLGGDEATGDRLLRRLFHVGGAAVLAYYLLPPEFFVVASTEDVLLLALGVVLALEAARLLGGLEIPTIREYERRRVASYAWFGIALVAAVVLFPKSVAVTVVLGTALVDPAIGELRRGPHRVARLYPWVPVALYATIGALVLSFGGWAPTRTVLAAVGAALVAVAVERPKIHAVDDDLAMTILPALLLVAAGLIGPGAPLGGVWP